MMKHMLIPMDASPAAESVLARLWHFLARPDTDVTLVHAIELPMGAKLDPAREDEMAAEGHEYMKAVVKRLSGRGVRCRAVVKPGPAADLIVATAAELSGGMIAMSTHGRSGLARVAFGSVAESVIRRTPVPVLLFRTPENDTAGRDGAPQELAVRHILVPIDGSLLSLAVAPQVGELARAFGAFVTLVHVLPPVPASADSVSHAQRILDVASARFADEKIEVKAIIRTGDAAEEIVDAARKLKADLVACTTHGRTGIARAVMGSVAEKVLRTSPIPLLVTRGPA